MPVSPNPTTAAINRICPPDASNSHGTAVVQLKEKEHLLADISESIRLFGYDCGTLDEAHSLIPDILSQTRSEGNETVHLSFLAAFYEGYKQYGNQLGTAITTNLTDFRDFVANESQSCFVEAIDLYYDCAFTRQGITLVDTPGADSINARHTGVAFDYIKNSDAILFVTYFNHAFSKADREFLIQLGRVKDAFELDKMFFIVNATDLATSADEVDEVLTYVKDQLTGYGIRFPRLFGVSSKLAQVSESREASNIDAFNAEFNDFLAHDLTKMALQAAEAEFNRAVQILDQLIASANQNESEKAKRKKELLQTREQMKEWLSQAEPGTLIERLSQESQELLYYVKQRVFFRFSDFFKEAFNPATLQNNHRALLKKALDELLYSVGYDFSQEMRATSLRIERHLHKLVEERYQMMEAEMQSLQAGLTLSAFEKQQTETLNFRPAFVEIDDKSLEQSFKHFKNPKSFFENNGRKWMEEELQEHLSSLADEYLATERARIDRHYHDALFVEFNRMVVSISTDIDDQYVAWLEAFDDAGKISDWTRIRNALVEEGK